MHNIHPHPKFSIITVTYNAEKVLEDTYKALLPNLIRTWNISL